MPSPRRKTAIWIALSLVVLLLALIGPVVWRWMSWQRDYGEAERLVETIRLMVPALRDFEKEFGRGPVDLAELTSFDRELNLSALTPYQFTLNQKGEQRFFVRVNERFSFGIDDRFNFSWVGAVAVGQAATDAPDE